MQWNPEKNIKDVQMLSLNFAWGTKKEKPALPPPACLSERHAKGKLLGGDRPNSNLQPSGQATWDRRWMHQFQSREKDT